MSMFVQAKSPHAQPYSPLSMGTIFFLEPQPTIQAHLNAAAGRAGKSVLYKLQEVWEAIQSQAVEDTV